MHEKQKRNVKKLQENNCLKLSLYNVRLYNMACQHVDYDDLIEEFGPD